MECDDWDSLSSDSELLEQDLKDEEEYNYTSNSSSKLQFRFLMEIGALLLLSENDESISLETMYQQLAEEKDGCCWELYEVYKHLKSLGYIVGRHDIPWSLKSVKRNTGTVSSEGTSESLELHSPQDCNSLIKRFIKMDLNELKPVFDVYLPNGKFRKSSPGDPSYVLCLIRGQPPAKIEIEALERQCGDIPLKFCLVEQGRVSFFSFSKVELPVLP
ncbi:uncharacterized protein LOC115674891 isoform X3 [Syzygium oleosum]|uniref:uncharacterized protein LOC115674891 isoform X3 n=1 Tax=Syzygium oleosum TaxID=219896 RepID=UPI0024B9EFBB|nr:uncharacterized protein LOC115674891 isoform X3 [Syzygium oleosum]